MNEYWKRIFVSAVKARIEREQRTAEEIIQEYSKLTELEKAELFAEVTAE